MLGVWAVMLRRQVQHLPYIEIGLPGGVGIGSDLGGKEIAEKPCSSLVTIHPKLAEVLVHAEVIDDVMMGLTLMAEPLP